ncbi:MAG: polyphosphate polymerase domain-containing protein [Synergistaceae bacterium]|nr:polyphosphate polymerase domain-containing protein [Synergistaceae bacterium]
MLNKFFHREPKKFRHELKYLVNMSHLTIIDNNISSIMDIDKNIVAGNTYSIRSLYFDDIDNSAFASNVNGTDPREKFRIRIYNASTKHIALELKKKEATLTQKISCAIDFDTACKLINGTLEYDEALPPLLKKFFVLQETHLLHPTIIVEYDRKPYVYADGNVRVTFDTNIRASSNMQSFFDKNLVCTPVLLWGHHVLEVKFDEFFPDFIRHAAQVNGLSQTTFSKFYLCKTREEILL